MRYFNILSAPLATAPTTPQLFRVSPACTVFGAGRFKNRSCFLTTTYSLHFSSFAFSARRLCCQKVRLLVPFLLLFVLQDP